MAQKGRSTLTAPGFERSALTDRMDEVMVILLVHHASIIIVPASLVWARAAAFGYFIDNARTAR